MSNYGRNDFQTFLNYQTFPNEPIFLYVVNHSLSQFCAKGTLVWNCLAKGKLGFSEIELKEKDLALKLYFLARGLCGNLPSPTGTALAP